MHGVFKAPIYIFPSFYHIRSCPNAHPERKCGNQTRRTGCFSPFHAISWWLCRRYAQRIDAHRERPGLVPTPQAPPAVARVGIPSGMTAILFADSTALTATPHSARKPVTSTASCAASYERETTNARASGEETAGDGADRLWMAASRQAAGAQIGAAMA